MIKHQSMGSKIGKISHCSTNKNTCIKQCPYCYGDKSLKQYPAVKKNYDGNTLALINRDKLSFISKSRKYHRFNLVGDFSFKNDLDTSIYYIQEYIRLAKHHDGINAHRVQFFGYTKSWQDKKLVPYLKEFNKLENVSLRCSVDATTGIRIPKGFKKAGIKYICWESMGIPLKGQYICQYGNKDHKMYKVKCDTCKICINKKCNVDVYFPAH
jgi:hypothetical protein